MLMITLAYGGGPAHRGTYLTYGSAGQIFRWLTITKAASGRSTVGLA